MSAETFLAQERNVILGDAEAALARSQAQHYAAAGSDEVRRRLELLFDRLLEGIQRRDLGPMIEYATKLAEERFEGGYDLVECRRRSMRSRRRLGGKADALGLISTLLGAGKDALARRYVSLAADTHAPSLNLRALFSGTD